MFVDASARRLCPLPPPPPPCRRRRASRATLSTRCAPRDGGVVPALTCFYNRSVPMLFC